MIELDVTDPEHLERLPDLVREHVDGLDGVVHSIAFGNPETLLGGKFLDGPWEDVAQAVQVSAYSLKSLSTACLPLMTEGGSVVGMTFDATVAWPAYDWMGVAKAGLESTLALPRARPRPAGRAGQPGLGRAAEDARREGDPRASRTSSRCGATARRWAGTRRTPSPPPGASSRCSATSSRPPPARSCTWTAATTRWAPERPGTLLGLVLGSVRRMTSALVELRVLEGPNLYFPRAAIKLTLDLTALIDAPLEVAQRLRDPDRAARRPAGGAGQRVPVPWVST